MKISLPDDRVPRALICRWAGVKEPTHASWAARGLVRDPGAAGCDIADAVELVVVARLIAALGPDDARLAYRQVRDGIRELTELDSILDVVWDVRLQEATLVKREADVLPLVRTGNAVRVMPVAHQVGEVMASHQRAITDRWALAQSRRSRAVRPKPIVQLRER